MQLFPKEGVSTVLRNVFDFDAYDKDMKDTLESVFNRHHIPISANRNNVKLSEK